MPASQPVPPDRVRQYVLNNILDNYDANSAPYDRRQAAPVIPSSSEPSCPNGNPVVVDVQFTLDTLRVERVRSYARLFFNGRLNLEWDDARLSYEDAVPAGLICPSIELSSDLVWRPDAFFANAEKSKHIFVDDPIAEQALSISTSGRVLWTRRARPKILCQFDYTRLPCEPQRSSPLPPFSSPLPRLALPCCASLALSPRPLPVSHQPRREAPPTRGLALARLQMTRSTAAWR